MGRKEKGGVEKQGGKESKGRERDGVRKKAAEKTAPSSHPVACICMHIDGDAKVQLSCDSIKFENKKKGEKV